MLCTAESIVRMKSKNSGSSAWNVNVCVCSRVFKMFLDTAVDGIITVVTVMVFIFVPSSSSSS